MLNRKYVVHSLIRALAFEVLEFIRGAEAKYPDGWVPAADVKTALELNFVAVPQGNEQYGEKGWLFAILARMLEDEGAVEYKKEGSRAFYRSRNPT